MQLSKFPVHRISHTWSNFSNEECLLTWMIQSNSLLSNIMLSNMDGNVITLQTYDFWFYNY